MTPNVKKNKQAGFSMLELVVAMTLMVIVLGASFSLMANSLKFSTNTYEMTDAQEAVRISHEYITRDLTSAGDGLKGISNMEVPAAFVTGYLTRTPVYDNSPGLPVNSYVNLGILSSDDNVPPGTSVPQPSGSPSTTVRGGTDRMTLAAVDTSFDPITLPAATSITFSGTTTKIQLSGANADRFSVGEIIAISSQTYTAFGVISSIPGAAGTARQLFLANGDTYGINQNAPTYAKAPINIASSNGTASTTLRRIQIIHYFVDMNGMNGRLIRRAFGVKGAGYVDSIIAEHIVLAQFRYFLGTRDSNGNVVKPVQVIANSAEQLAVRQVEAKIVAETVHATVSTAVIAGGHPQISMTMLTSIRNLQFNQALSPVGGG